MILKYKIADKLTIEHRSESDIVQDVIDLADMYGFILIEKEELEKLKEYKWMYKELCK